MSLDNDIRILSRVRLFDGFETEQLRLLAFGAEAIVVSEGEQIFAKGQNSEGGYVVASGTVRLASGEGTQTSEHRVGSMLGEMALITETKHAATATAVTRVDLLKITRPLFRRMLREYPQLAFMLQERIGRSLGDFVSKLDRVRLKLDRADNIPTQNS